MVKLAFIYMYYIANVCLVFVNVIADVFILHRSDF